MNAPAPRSVLLFERLREQTSVMHAEVEAMVSILHPGVTIDDYRGFLAMLWGFHHPLEQRLATVAGLYAVLPDLERRWKSRLLEADLSELGTSAAELPVGSEWPPLNTVDRALGCLYVLEGSTLGGRHIHRHLARTLPSIACATRFLTCYGEGSGRMWTAFRDSVLRAQATLDEGALVAAACETFEAVRRWFAQQRA